MVPIEIANYWLAVGTIAMQIAIVALVAVFFLEKKFPDLRDISVLAEKWGIFKSFVITIGASALTLYYSEILGIAPCAWCWMQRVFLYPQIILFGLALWKRDKTIADYSIGFSIAGFIVAMYQHYLQMGGTSVIPCPATADKATDCAVRFLFEFGYITFPLMAATLFVYLIVIMLFVRRSPR